MWPYSKPCFSPTSVDLGLPCVSPPTCALTLPKAFRFGLHAFGVIALIMNGDMLKKSFVRHLAKVAGRQVPAFCFTAHLATGNCSLTLLQGGPLISWGRGGTRPVLHKAFAAYHNDYSLSLALSLSVNHSPPLRRILYSFTSKVLCPRWQACTRWPTFNTACYT